jgi:ABC-type multidrug transport system fused ATPase/permease subunit
MDRGSINSALPVLSLYVFAGYRLMPSLQQIYVSFNKMTYVSPSLNSLYYDLKNLEKTDEKKDDNKIKINKKITLNDICYNYPNSSKTTLRNVSINIPARTTVGLMGTTGSGKTTTIDIILGLLEAQEGTLEVDGQVITKNNSRAWQRSIGYVPQHIYLADDSVAANIAFGTTSKEINYDAVEKAAKIANLHDFVINELPKKYETKVGERGIRLSGGQRQRIGIARALYHNPSVIILDEATSSLDNDTEKLVMNAIEKLGQNKTIILIAHRLSTLKNCDKIFLMEKGEMKREMTYKELNETEFNLQQNLNDKSKLKFIN